MSRARTRNEAALQVDTCTESVVLAKVRIETNIFDYVRDLDEFERVWSFFPMDCCVAAERGLLFRVSPIY